MFTKLTKQHLEQDFMEKIDVILTTHNRLNFLKNAVASVQAQSFKDWRLWIIDDASKDGTADWIRAIASDNVNSVSLPENKGLSAARNVGWRLGSAPYVAFLDDDDTWFPDKLMIQEKALRTSSNAYGLVYCWAKYDLGNDRFSIRAPTYSGNIHHECLTGQPITNASCWLVRRSALEATGGFVENVRRGVDGSFLCKLSKAFLVGVSAEILVVYNHSFDHHRITGRNPVTIRAGLHQLEWRQSTFQEEYSKNPALKAAVQLDQAAYHAYLGEPKSAIQCVSTALKLYPTSVFQLRRMARILKWAFGK